jgi:hypothetical protein
MVGGSAATGGYYYLEEVPWTLYFYSGYALHGAYWHDAFGRPRSHGCVNLSLFDSWWIFKWSEAGGKNSPAVYVYWEYASGKTKRAATINVAAHFVFLFALRAIRFQR